MNNAFSVSGVSPSVFASVASYFGPHLVAWASLGLGVLVGGCVGLGFLLGFRH